MPRTSHLAPETAADSAIDARVAGLLAFNHNLKQNSRERLLAAATSLFGRDGYSAVSIEKITTAAGVSRITYYRHFPTKAAMALELFQRTAAQTVPHMLDIAKRDFRDRATVCRWLTEYFELNLSMQDVLRVLIEANVAEKDFSEEVRPFVFDLIAELGREIEEFAIDRNASGGEQRWVEAYLLIYTILDQGNHAAIRRGIATSPMMIEVLATQFLIFVGEEKPRANA